MSNMVTNCCEIPGAVLIMDWLLELHKIEVDHMINIIADKRGPGFQEMLDKLNNCREFKQM
jgi:hypothetical protein